MKSASPFIVVEHCREAVQYYQSVFGGEARVLFAKGEQWMHAELHVGGSKIHFTEMMGNVSSKGAGENIKIILELESEDELKRIFEALGKDGHVTVELQDTFFGALHGQVTDKHHVGWVMNYFRS